MKTRGFTLVELLAILVILGVIAVIITPVIQKTLKANKESVYNVIVEQVKEYTKDYLAKNPSEMPDEDGTSTRIEFGTLKKAGVLQINVVNPKTNNVISDESFVEVTRRDNNYVYKVTTYDLEGVVEETIPAQTLSGASTKTCTTATDCHLDDAGENVSRQIIYNEKEVSSISDEGTYTIYYTKLKDGVLAVTIQTVIVGQ